MTMNKTACPLTRAELKANAPKLRVIIQRVDDGSTLFTETMGIRDFQTGSIGYNVSGKTTVPCSGTDVKFQVGYNLTAVGSKELPPA